MKHVESKKSNYTFKDDLEIIIHNNTNNSSNNFKKKQIQFKNKNNVRPDLNKYLTQMNIRDNTNKSESLNRSGIQKGMFSYPKTSRSVESSPYSKFINSKSNNSVINKSGSVNFNMSSRIDKNSPNNASVSESSNQSYILRNFSLDKYRISSPIENVNVSSIIKREDSMSSLKFDLSKFKAGGSNKLLGNIENDINPEPYENKEKNDRSLNDKNGKSNSNRKNSSIDIKQVKISKINKNLKTLNDNEKENRRLLIELIKFKMLKNKTNLAKTIEELKIDNKLKEIITPVPNYKFSDLNNNSNTTDIFKPVEIKNNNFEINNNFYGSVKLDTNTNSINVLNSNILSQANINLLDDSSDEKLKHLYFLITPRILTINFIKSRTAYIFQVSPTNLCHTHVYEHYVLKWSDLKSLSQVGSIDFMKIHQCVENSEKSFLLKLINENQGDIRAYEIMTESASDCKKYINGLNYLVQLIKCKYIKEKK